MINKIVPTFLINQTATFPKDFGYSRLPHGFKMLTTGIAIVVVAGLIGATVASSVVNAEEPISETTAEEIELSSDTRITPSNSDICSGVGTVWWNELLAPETKTLGGFYSNLFGWKSKLVDVTDQDAPPSTENDRYTIFMSGEDEIAGMMSENHPEAIKPQGKGWFVYIQVADVEHTITVAEQQGGTIIQRPFDIAGGHRVAVIRDPGGNFFGVVTPAGFSNCKLAAVKAD